MTPKTETAPPDLGINEGMSVTQKLPELLTLPVNQMQAKGAKDAVEDILQEEADIKDATGEADASIFRIEIIHQKLQGKS